MKHKRTVALITALLIAAFSWVPTGFAEDEVADLLAQSKATLAAHRDAPASARDYAQCIYNLEKAQEHLEKKNDSSSALAQEVNATLFWAKRFSNIEISNEIAKLRAAGGAPKMPAAPLAKTPASKPAAPGASVPEAEIITKAKAAFEEAERFSQSKASDPFAVSLRWFQVSSQFSGTEYAMLALEKARDAQTKLAAVNPSAKQSALAKEKEEVKAAVPEYDLLREGELLETAGKFDEALAKYLESVKLKDTIPANRHIGHVHFKLAQKVEEKLLPKYQTLDKEYATANKAAYENRGGNIFFNSHNPQWVAAQKKLDDLRKEADGITLHAASAQASFDKIIKLAPEHKDFDAAAYSAVSMSRRPTLKLTARSYIKEFLKNYTPADGFEQVTYEYCKSEFERLGK